MRGSVQRPEEGQEMSDAKSMFQERRTFAPVQFQIEPDVRKELRRIAYEEERSMSEIVREAIDQYLAKRQD